MMLEGCLRLGKQEQKVVQRGKKSIPKQMLKKVKLSEMKRQIDRLKAFGLDSDKAMKMREAAKLRGKNKEKKKMRKLRALKMRRLRTLKMETELFSESTIPQTILDRELKVRS